MRDYALCDHCTTKVISHLLGLASECHPDMIAKMDEIRRSSSREDLLRSLGYMIHKTGET